MKRIIIALVGLGLSGCTAVTPTEDSLPAFPTPVAREEVEIDLGTMDGEEITEIREIDIFDDDEATEEDEYTLFEGDIIIPIVRNDDGSVARASFFGQVRRWTDGRVPYVIDDAFSADRVEVIEEAMETLEDIAGVDFVERAGERNFVNIRSVSAGCSAQVGMVGGSQRVNLGPRCSRAPVIHELLHALGFRHEHTRPGRDEFVNIEWDNIVADKAHNFRVSPGERIGPYDFDSIMHYPGFTGPAFAIDTDLPIITRVDGGRLPYIYVLSDGDRDGLRQMYPEGNRPPEPVRGLRVEVYGRDNFELFWNRSSDPEGEAVRYVVHGGGLRARHTDGTSMYFRNTDRSENRTFVVAAMDSRGNFSAQTSIVVPRVGTNPEPPPQPPQPQPNTNNPTPVSYLRGDVYGRSNLEIFWNRASDADGRVVGYEITENGVRLPLRDGASLYRSGLNSGTTYRYRVVAVDNDGNRSAAREVSLRTR